MSVACGGTVVYEDLALAFDARLAHEPWSAGRVAGILDFPDFAVAPGSRRGVLLDEAADAFARVVETALAPVVREHVARDDARRAAAVEADLVQKLERAFRDLAREAPEYDFLAVRGRERTGGATTAPDGGRAIEAEPPDAVALEAATRLFPPGPLARVEIVPARARVERLGERRLRARATDAEGVRVAGVACAWSVASGPGAIDATESTDAVFRAGETTGTAVVAVVARKDGREARAEATVDVVEEIAGGSPRAGIPEPAFVAEPRADWRSRLADGRWEVNAAHRDYVSVDGIPRRKLRYLAALLAKEIVVHSFPLPQGGMLLERLVSVLTVTERRLERG